MLAQEDSSKLAPNVCNVILTAQPVLIPLISIVLYAIQRLISLEVGFASALAPTVTKRISSITCATSIPISLQSLNSNFRTSILIALVINTRQEKQVSVHHVTLVAKHAWEVPTKTAPRVALENTWLAGDAIRVTHKVWSRGHQVSALKNAVTALISEWWSATMETTRMATDAQANAKLRRIGSALEVLLHQKINVYLKN